MLSKIDKSSNINLKNGLYSFNDIINTDFLPQRLIRSLGEIRPNFLFIFNLKPIILFFGKNKDKNEMFKQCWYFA